MPTLANIAAAQHGDKAALQHLAKLFKENTAAQLPAADSEEPSNGSNGNLAGFFPSLERRLKRLDRMGAHVELESDGRKTWIVVVVLSVLLGPFALLALALLLVLIGILTLASLAFLAIWMAVIHQLFVVFLHH